VLGWGCVDGRQIKPQVLPTPGGVSSNQSRKANRSIVSPAPSAGAVLAYSGLMRRAFPILALSLALGMPAAEVNAKPTTADLTDLPLEALMDIEVPKVYAASKIEQRETQAPASITVVGSDEIKKYGYRTLADILASVPGLNVSYDRNYDFLGIRGVSLGDFNSRMLLLVNGHRVNNNLTDGAAIGTDFILDIDLIDRVEVIRGPEAVLYGNNAFFGVINVVTRQGGQVNGVESSVEYGSFNTYKARLTYGKLFTNGVQMLLSGTYYDNAGQSSLYYPEFDQRINPGNPLASNNGVAQNMDGDLYGSFFGSLGYRDFTLEGAFNHREKENPTAQYLTTFNDPRLRTTDERSYAAFKYAHSFPDIVDVTAQLYYDRYNYDIGYPFGTTLYQEQDFGEWWGAELQLNKRLWDRHVITLGAEYRDDFRQDSSIFDPTAPDQGSYTSTNRQNYGIYVQGDFEVRTNLHLIAGLRYDQYGDFEPALDPRVAAIYRAWEKSTFKAIYGTAFRAPNFTELSDPRFQDIKPEKITSYELVYEQDIGRHLRSSLSGFYNQMNDLIVLDSGSFTNFNANTKGVELALEGFWASGIRGRASYSFQDTQDTAAGWSVPDSPNHLLKFNLSVPIVKDKVFVGLEYQYTSDRLSLNTTYVNNQPITVQGEDAASFGIFNLTLFSQKLVKNLEFSASVYNVLDARYSDPASSYHTPDVIRQNGRSFRLKLTYRF
jgi:outer membrane receptor for ferrienterochelin and colicins